MSATRRENLTEEARSKREWRRTILSAIAALDPQERQAQESALVDAFLALPGWAEARTVLLYVSAFPEELRTAPFLSMSYDAGKRLILPRVDRAEWRLRLHLVSDPTSQLTPGTLGILEPLADLPEVPVHAVDWALIPGVAFDRRGYRLGRGAGHYDRLLPGMRPDCLCWALCLDCQLVTGLPVEPHDIAMDGVTASSRTVRGVGRSRTGS
jgi:5-formyltetrahydrofolate cyclo-ligase